MIWFGLAQTLDKADAACASSFACDLDTVSLFSALPGVLALIPPSYAPTGSALWFWCRALCDVAARILDAVNATAQSVLGSGTLFQGSDADYAGERQELVMRDALGWLLSPPPPPEDASSLPRAAVSLIKTEIGLVSGGGGAAGHDWRWGSGACVITLARLLSTGPRRLMPHAVAVVSLAALKLLDVAASQYALHPGDRTPLALFGACAAFADASRTCGASASARRADGDGAGGGGGGPTMHAHDDLRATVEALRGVGDVAWSVPAIENVLKAVLMRCVRALANSRRIAHGSWAEAEHTYKADVVGTFFDALPWLWAAAHGAAGGIPDSTEMMLWRVVGHIFSPKLRSSSKGRRPLFPYSRRIVISALAHMAAAGNLRRTDKCRTMVVEFLPTLQQYQNSLKRTGKSAQWLGIHSNLLAWVQEAVATAAVDPDTIDNTGGASGGGASGGGSGGSAGVGDAVGAVDGSSDGACAARTGGSGGGGNMDIILPADDAGGDRGGRDGRDVIDVDRVRAATDSSGADTGDVVDIDGADGGRVDGDGGDGNGGGGDVVVDLCSEDDDEVELMAVFLAPRPLQPPPVSGALLEACRPRRRFADTAGVSTVFDVDTMDVTDVDHVQGPRPSEVPRAPRVSARRMTQSPPLSPVLPASAVPPSPLKRPRSPVLPASAVPPSPLERPRSQHVPPPRAVPYRHVPATSSSPPPSHASRSLPGPASPQASSAGDAPVRQLPNPRAEYGLSVLASSTDGWVLRTGRATPTASTASRGLSPVHAAAGWQRVVLAVSVDRARQGLHLLATMCGHGAPRRGVAGQVSVSTRLLFKHPQVLVAHVNARADAFHQLLATASFVDQSTSTWNLLIEVRCPARSPAASNDAVNRVRGGIGTRYQRRTGVDRGRDIPSVLDVDVGVLCNVWFPVWDENHTQDATSRAVDAVLTRRVFKDAKDGEPRRVQLMVSIRGRLPRACPSSVALSVTADASSDAAEFHGLARWESLPVDLQASLAIYTPPAAHVPTTDSAHGSGYRTDARVAEFGADLDDSQRSAVCLALDAVLGGGDRGGGDVTTQLINGPPGTGKTRTLVALVRCVEAAGLDALVVSRTNVAANEVLAALHEHFPSESTISRDARRVVRIGMAPPDGHPASQAHVDAVVARCVAAEHLHLQAEYEAASGLVASLTAGSRRHDGYPAPPDQHAVARAVDAQERLRRAEKALDAATRSTRRAVCATARMLVTTIASSVLSDIGGRGCSLIICDEAAAVSTPAVVSSVVRAPRCIRGGADGGRGGDSGRRRGDTDPADTTRCVVLVGDPAQLPPSAGPVSYRGATVAMGLSAFERCVSGRRHVCTTLRHQYRMRPALSRIPYLLFYARRTGSRHQPHSARLAALDVPGGHPPWMANIPAVLVESTSTSALRHQGRDVGSCSVRNDFEVTLVKRSLVNIIRAWHAAAAPHDLRVRVVAPYAAQVAALAVAVADVTAEHVTRVRSSVYRLTVKVDTVDASQGASDHVLILSLCRTARAEDLGTRRAGIGFVGDHRRMNVGLTRAALHVHVVGDIDCIVAASPIWRQWFRAVREEVRGGSPLYAVRDTVR